MSDPFYLQRFVDAQSPMLATVMQELQAGQKRTHWTWFIFPQLVGLGHSHTAQFYAIDSLAEAIAYLEHPLLGPRLADCTKAVIDSQESSLRRLFGSPDDVKFHSSMTLFALASRDESIFIKAIEQRCNGVMDTKTIQLLSNQISK